MLLPVKKRSFVPPVQVQSTSFRTRHDRVFAVLVRVTRQRLTCDHLQDLLGNCHPADFDPIPIRVGGVGVMTPELVGSVDDTYVEVTYVDRVGRFI